MILKKIIEHVVICSLLCFNFYLLVAHFASHARKCEREGECTWMCACRVGTRASREVNNNNKPRSVGLPCWSSTQLVLGKLCHYIAGSWLPGRYMDIYIWSPRLHAVPCFMGTPSRSPWGRLTIAQFQGNPRSGKRSFSTLMQSKASVLQQRFCEIEAFFEVLTPILR